jgi:hypothetical protein
VRSPSILKNGSRNILNGSVISEVRKIFIIEIEVEIVLCCFREGEKFIYEDIERE